MMMMILWHTKLKVHGRRGEIGSTKQQQSTKTPSHFSLPFHPICLARVMTQLSMMLNGLRTQNIKTRANFSLGIIYMELCVRKQRHVLLPFFCIQLMRTQIYLWLFLTAYMIMQRWEKDEDIFLYRFLYFCLRVMFF